MRSLRWIPRSFPHHCSRHYSSWNRRKAAPAQCAGGPRTLDLDLLLYDTLVSEDPNLTLPHPRLQERAFVLQPLYDLAPQLSIPGQGPVRELWAKISKQGLSRLDGTL